jgi:Zn ribbon nucleic-acid-binding protein
MSTVQTNHNCLEGLRCPDCGNADRLRIVARIMADVTDDGAEMAHGSQMDWDDDSMAVCPECDHDGPLAGFRDRRLPPDPERMNDSRAEWAGHALAAFMSQTGTDAGSALTDLLCDLMHRADRDGTDFDADLALARIHYASETGAADPDGSTHSNPNERTCL